MPCHAEREVLPHCMHCCGRLQNCGETSNFWGCTPPAPRPLQPPTLRFGAERLGHGDERRRAFIIGFSSGALLLPEGLGVRAGGGTGLLPAGSPRMGALTQGSPPPEPPHRPDPTPRVPGGVDVRVCKAKAEELSGGDGGDMEGRTGHCTHGWGG